MRKTLTIVSMLVLAAMLVPTAALASNGITARGVQPTVHAGNFVSTDDDQVCYDIAELTGDAPENEWRGFKVDPPTNFENDFVKITISADGKSLDWETKGSTKMLYLILKGGPNYHLYDYAPYNYPDDQGLHSPLHKRNVPQISHYNVCYDPGELDGNGCTPGFWRNNTPANQPAWNTLFTLYGITKASTFNSTGLSLESALTSRGGGLNALLRHGSAAYLNALHPGVDYGLDAATVLAQFETAYFSGDAAAIEAQKDAFAARNESGCPLSATNG